MKSLTSVLTIAIAALTLAAPASVFAKNGHRSSGGYCRSGGGTAVFVSGGGSGFYGGGRGYYGGGYQPYCAPVYRPYCAPQPAFYSGSSISVGFGTSPAYYGPEAYYGSGAYYDSYPTRAVYRGVPVNRYRENARYDDDLSVDVQRALARRGFYRGSIDGDVGPGTRAAIRSYQYDRGLEVTGRIDNSLLRSLRLS